MAKQVRGLNCFFGISRLFYDSALSLEQLFLEVISRLLTGCQYPGLTCARIVFEGRTFQLKKCRDSAGKHLSEIEVDNEPVGRLEICYNKNRKGEVEPFSKKGLQLFNVIAEGLGRNIQCRRVRAELAAQKNILAGKNIALNEVLTHIEEKSNKVKRDITTNIDNLVMPILRRLSVRGGARDLVALLRRNLDDIASSFQHKISNISPELTPRELEVCKMIKTGLSSKEIARILETSYLTVEKQRRDIRRKLRISRTDVNLASFLQKI